MERIENRLVKKREGFSEAGGGCWQEECLRAMLIDMRRAGVKNPSEQVALRKLQEDLTRYESLDVIAKTRIAWDYGFVSPRDYLVAAKMNFRDLSDYVVRRNEGIGVD